MAGWQVFGTLAAGNQPLSLFDTLSGQIAQTVIVPTTATGTNVIALALNTNAPTITAYNNFQQFSFVAANNSTGSVTVNVNSIGAVNLYKPGGIQAGSGDITSGVLYVIAFNQALNAGGGGFQIVSATPASLSLPVTVVNGGTGLTSLTAFAVLCGGTTGTGNVQPLASLGTAGQPLVSNGAGALPSFQSLGAGVGSLVTIQAFTTSQTITIPATATKALTHLVGGGGGCTSSGPSTSSPGAGAGGFCMSLLTGLTPGNTLALTIGAGGNGGVSPTSGGASSLSSGTQTITTQTANGGAVGAGGGVASPGGTASGGNLLNITGEDGSAALNVAGGVCSASSYFLFGGSPAFGFGMGNKAGGQITGGGSAKGFGAGGGNSNGAGTQVGTAGILFVFWYT